MITIKYRPYWTPLSLITIINNIKNAYITCGMWLQVIKIKYR